MEPGAIVCLLITVKDRLLVFGIRLSIHFIPLSQRSDTPTVVSLRPGSSLPVCEWARRTCLGLMLEWVGRRGEHCQQMDPSQALKDVHFGIWQEVENTPACNRKFKRTGQSDGARNKIQFFLCEPRGLEGRVVSQAAHRTRARRQAKAKKETNK